MQMRAQNCMMTRDLDASREQDLKSTCIHRSPVASAGWRAACLAGRLAGRLAAWLAARLVGRPAASVPIAEA